MSTASETPRKCPPLTSAAQPKREWICFAAARIASTEAGLHPAKISASSRFGVTSAASGRSFSHNIFTAFGSSNFAPLVEIQSGSTTNCRLPIADCRFRKKSATTEIFSAENSIPVFTAAGGNSPNTASICCLSILGETVSTPMTRRGFCAVRQAMALAPWTPSAAKVFKSAWMPAPPPLSEPAMVRATGNCLRLLCIAGILAGKLQAPSSNLQRNFNLQFASQTCAAFEACVIGASLELGI